MPKIQPRPTNTSVSQYLSQQGIPPTLARLYAARGVTTLQETQAKLSGLLPVESLKGIHQMGIDLADAIKTEVRGSLNLTCEL